MGNISFLPERMLALSSDGTLQVTLSFLSETYRLQAPDSSGAENITRLPSPVKYMELQ